MTSPLVTLAHDAAQIFIDEHTIAALRVADANALAHHNYAAAQGFENQSSTLTHQIEHISADALHIVDFGLVGVPLAVAQDFGNFFSHYAHG